MLRQRRNDRLIATVFFEMASGARLGYGHARAMIQSLLTGVRATSSGLASTYYMRRGSATLCKTWAKEAEAAANRYRLSKRSSDMSTGYGLRVRQALLAKRAADYFLNLARAQIPVLDWNR